MVNWRDHITIDPDIVFGKPCFKGTRIPVELVLEKIAFGQPLDDLLKSCPKLTGESVQAAQL